MANYETKKLFSERLSTLLEIRRITQLDLASEMGVSTSTVSSWCTGDKMPRMDKIEWMANFFNISISQLIEPNGTKTETVGQRIKQRRKELGISAEFLADLVSLSPATIYRYENGDIEKIPANYVLNIAHYLAVPPARLLGEPDDCETTDISAAAKRQALEYVSLFSSLPAQSRDYIISLMIDLSRKSENCKKEI